MARQPPFGSASDPGRWKWPFFSSGRRGMVNGLFFSTRTPRRCPPFPGRDVSVGSRGWLVRESCPPSPSGVKVGPAALLALRRAFLSALFRPKALFPLSTTARGMGFSGQVTSLFSMGLVETDGGLRWDIYVLGKGGRWLPLSVFSPDPGEDPLFPRSSPLSGWVFMG